jgi:hypothetical protein
LTSVGEDDIFLARFDAGGAHVWSQGFGDANDHSPVQNVATDGAGNIYLSGEFSGTVDFGGGSLTSAGQGDVFAAKFSPGGEHQWSERFGDASSQGAAAMAVTPSGELFIAGWNLGTLNLGALPTLTNGGYLARFSSEGEPVSSAGYGTAVTVRTVVVDSWGNLLMAGDKSATADFGGGPLAQVGSVDVFLVKLGQTATAVPDYPSRDALDLRVHPNPFNPTTRITYTLPEAGPVRLRVLDAAGRLVERLVDDDHHDAGSYTLHYRASGASGVYFVCIDAGGNRRVRKAVLLK